MYINNNKLIKVLITFFIVTLFLTSQSSISASSTSDWQDNFDDGNLNGWNLQGYDLYGGLYLSPIAHGFTIENGELTAPSTSSYAPLHRALHDSSVAYGNWSFDWQVNNQNAYDAVEFALTDHSDNPYNFTGRTFPQIDHLSGYALAMCSYSFEIGPGLALLRFNPNDTVAPTLLQSYKFSGNIVGSHHIQISRDLNGNFTVSFDSNQIINVVDTIFSSSEKFTFVSFQGNSSIDNIVIESLEPTPPTPLYGTTIFLSLSILAIVLLKRRKLGLR